MTRGPTDPVLTSMRAGRTGNRRRAGTAGMRWELRRVSELMHPERRLRAGHRTVGRR